MQTRSGRFATKPEKAITMSTDLRTRAKEVFLAAIDKHPPEQWGSYLDEACRDDPDLRRRVDDLLQAHLGEDSLLDQPATTVDQSPITEGPGTIIGPYKLLQEIGSGGFGTVYMAEQEEPVRRRVALKVIKLGMDTKEVIARFEVERQVLVLMDHPSIAKVLDADDVADLVLMAIRISDRATVSEVEIRPIDP